MRILIVEDEPYLADSMAEGLRREAFSVDVAYDGATAMEMLGVNAYDAVVLDRDVPAPSGDEIARWMVAEGLPARLIMVTAADRLDDKVSGFETGVDDYLPKPFMLKELTLRLRALLRRPGAARPPVLESAGVRLDPFRRDVSRDGRPVALTRKQFAVLELLMQADGGVISAEELLEKAWDENA
uniref:response regulator transcription factor n=1 Tax=Arthrobacter sp. TaxID=1667 RepID=UPI0025891BD6